MAEEAIFEYLHSEIVNYTLTKETNKENDLSALEYIGYSTGYRIIERLTREWPRFKDELDTMKFICTDFWSSIYKKQIDNLRTNHQGVYVLQDNAFRFLTRLSSSSQYLEHAPKVSLREREGVERVLMHAYFSIAVCGHLRAGWCWKLGESGHHEHGDRRGTNHAFVQIPYPSE
nr:trafficking protein particle complex subunit 6b isoform X1 [Aedes albopictus]